MHSTVYITAVIKILFLSDDAAGDLQIFGTLFSCILIFFEKSLILVFSSYLVHFWWKNSQI